jgi:hypothetical protein
MVFTVSHLVRTAPDDIELPEEALEQTVGWLSRAQRPASLREFIAAQAPQRVMASLDVSPSEAPGEPVKRVTELDESELQHVVVAVLREAPPDSVLAIVGEGNYSPARLIRLVEAGRPLGRELTAATARHIELLEGLIEAGKIKELSHQGSSPELEINLHF